MGDSAMLALIEAWETGLAPSLEELDLRLCAMGSTSLMYVFQRPFICPRPRYSPRHLKSTPHVPRLTHGTALPPPPPPPTCRRLVNAIRRGTFPSLRTLALGTEAEDFWRPNQVGIDRLRLLVPSDHLI